MAWEAIKGTGGNVTGIGASNFFAKLVAWSAVADWNTEEITGFGDDNYRKFNAAGPISMSGSAGGFLSGTTAEPPIPLAMLAATGDLDEAEVTLTLTANANRTFSGTAIISQVQMTRTEGGNATVTFNFVFTGRITPTWTNP